MQPIIESFEKQILFAANASHELRTPLSVLLSGLDVLKDDTDNKLTVFSQEIMGDMKSEILKMKMLIGNLLLLARCDSSAIGIKKQKIIINDVVNGVAVRFLSIAEDKNIKIVIVNKNDQIKTYFDRSHLQQILTILIDNAVKYTPKNGHITLSIDKETIPVVSVVNTGCGISAEDLPHIFERFYRSITVQKYDGSGLGLSIAKALAEKNGGRLAAESRENVDTTFFLYLPPTE
nr:HAMP domain-containing sensor histidine kinase [Pectinatus sottacetonis]